MKYLVFFMAFVCVSVSAFDAQVMCTKAQNLRDQWDGILPGRPPHISLSSNVVRLEPFSANVFFSNPTVKDGKVNVTGKLIVRTPDGKTMFSSDLEAQTFECPNPESVFLFPNIIMVSFDPPDIPGEYVFSADLKDLNSGKSVSAQAKVLLEEKPSGKPDNEPLKTLCDYYRNLNPQNILPAFGAFLKMVPDLKKKQKASFNPLSMLAFFYYALQVNPQIHGEFAKMVDSLKEPESRYYGVIIMHELGEKSFAMLSRDSQSKWNPKLAGAFRIEKAEAPWQLDILWSEFFVTGKKAPLVKLVDAVRYINGNISVDEYKKLEKPTPEDKAALFRTLTGGAALWSLGSNATQHTLVAYYLEFMLAKKEIKDVFTAIAIAKKLEESGNTSVSVSVKKQ